MKNNFRFDKALIMSNSVRNIGLLEFLVCIVCCISKSFCWYIFPVDSYFRCYFQTFIANRKYFNDVFVCEQMHFIASLFRIIRIQFDSKLSSRIIYITKWSRFSCFWTKRETKTIWLINNESWAEKMYLSIEWPGKM